MDGAFKVAKKQSFGVRWVDVSKHDEANPQYRSILVTMEPEKPPMPKPYAATEGAKRLGPPVATVDGDDQPEFPDDVATTKCKSREARANDLVARRPVPNSFARG